MSIKEYIARLENASANADVNSIHNIVNEVKILILTTQVSEDEKSEFFYDCICVAVQGVKDEIYNYIQLYKTFCSQDSNPERKLFVKSVNLLYFLVSNNLSEFHAELELLSAEEMKSPMIQFSVNIEGYLTTGRYNKIQECMHHLPNPLFSHLMIYLIQSIIADIESCIEASYRSISLVDFSQTINWSHSADELISHIHEMHSEWSIGDDGVIRFPKKLVETEGETKKTLGDLITQINDIEMI